MLDPELKSVVVLVHLEVDLVIQDLVDLVVIEQVVLVHMGLHHLVVVVLVDLVMGDQMVGLEDLALDVLVALVKTQVALVLVVEVDLGNLAQTVQVVLVEAVPVDLVQIVQVGLVVSVQAGLAVVGLAALEKTQISNLIGVAGGEKCGVINNRRKRRFGFCFAILLLLLFSCTLLNRGYEELLAFLVVVKHTRHLSMSRWI